MKTIIYAGPFQMPDKNAAAHRVLNNAKILRTAGYNVVFVGLNPHADVAFMKSQYKYEAFSIYELRCNSSSEKMKQFSSFIWFEELLAVYDVVAVIAYDYYAIGLYRLMKICQKKGISIIADTDEWFSASGNSLLEKIVRKCDSEVRMRLIQPRLDAVITISKFLYNYYSDKTVTVRIPPLVDKSEEKWNNEFKIEKDDFLDIVYSGSPGVSKDKLDKVIVYLSAIENSYKIRLTIIGITKEEFLANNPYCENAIKNHDKIVFKGRIPHTEALQILQKADFSMFLREDNRVTKAGFPTKFVESISAGVPVITNNTSDLSDFLVSGENGFLLYDDIEGDLKDIFKKEVSELKAIKSKVDSNLFNYTNYVNELRSIIKIIKKE